MAVLAQKQMSPSSVNSKHSPVDPFLQCHLGDRDARCPLDLAAADALHLATRTVHRSPVTGHVCIPLLRRDGILRDIDGAKHGALALVVVSARREPVKGLSHV